MNATQHKKIFIAAPEYNKPDTDDFFRMLEELIRYAKDEEKDSIKPLMQKIIGM